MATAGEDIAMSEIPKPEAPKFTKKQAEAAFEHFGLAKRAVQVNDWLFIGEPPAIIKPTFLKRIEELLGQPRGAFPG